MNLPPPGAMLWIIDVSSVCYRMHYALPAQVYTSPTGQLVSALAGFVREVRTLRRKHGAEWILPVMDGGRGWRAELFPAYKADREDPPAELTDQIKLVPDLARALGVEAARVEGVEADDLIASYTEAAVSHGCAVTIVSTDKDLQQLVRGDGPGSVRVLSRRTMIGPAEVVEAFGVGPELLGDFLALAGDSTDGIPGVRGVGKSTAVRLLLEHGSLDRLLDRWSLVPGKMATKIRGGAESARLSRTLVGLRSDISLPVPAMRCRPSRAALDQFFAGYGYRRFEIAVDPVE